MFDRYAIWLEGTAEHNNLLDLWEKLDTNASEFTKVIGVDFSESRLGSHTYTLLMEHINKANKQHKHISEYGIIIDPSKYLFAKIKYSI